MKTNYFDGIPQWIWDLTPEERAKIIEEEKEKMEKAKKDQLEIKVLPK